MWITEGRAVRGAASAAATRATMARAAARASRGAGVVALLAACCLLVPACRQGMFNQPKVKPLAANDFFEDGMGARPPIEGTVARGELDADRAFGTGIGPDGKFVSALPVPLTRGLLARGRERYDIYCSPCHSRVGDGRGMIVERGFKAPPSYHIDRLRAQPIGYFFDVMTRGFGDMSDYAAQVRPADRWAIAAYIRALQLSQHAPLAGIPPPDRAAIETSDRAAIEPDHGAPIESGDPANVGRARP